MESNLIVLDSRQYAHEKLKGPTRITCDVGERGFILDIEIIYDQKIFTTKKKKQDGEEGQQFDQNTLEIKTN